MQVGWILVLANALQKPFSHISLFFLMQLSPANFLQIGISSKVIQNLSVDLFFVHLWLHWNIFLFFSFFVLSSLLSRSKDYSALPAKRLWHFLVKQELLQETFIRYIFTKKRKQSEVHKGCNFFFFNKVQL